VERSAVSDRRVPLARGPLNPEPYTLIESEFLHPNLKRLIAFRPPFATATLNVHVTV